MNQSSTPKVSVVIPFHNSRHSIEGCLESVFGQTYENIEVILVDDGSTDDMSSVLAPYQDRISLYHQENKGQGAARNLGLKHASGEFAVFLDADDEFKPSMVETCVNFLGNHSECVAVNTAFAIQQPDGSEVVKPVLEDDDQPNVEERVLDDFFEFWAKYDHVRTGTCMIRMSTIREAGGQKENLRISQDLEYWAYIATFGKWGYINEAHWLGRSVNYARKSGWFKKYLVRRRLCPTVDQWHERVLSRLDERQLENFRTVRGQVASNFIQAYLTVGNISKARSAFKNFKSDLPNNKPMKLVRLGAKFGWLGWISISYLVYWKEWIKSLRR